MSSIARIEIEILQGKVCETKLFWITKHTLAGGRNRTLEKSHIQCNKAQMKSVSGVVLF